MDAFSGKGMSKVDDFPEWSLKEINNRRYSYLEQTGQKTVGRITKAAISRRHLRHQLRDIARIQWADVSAKSDTPEPEPWEVVRKRMHYEVDDAENEYNDMVTKVKYEMDRRAEVEERLAEETAEVEELRASKNILDQEIQVSEEKRENLANSLADKTKELKADEAEIEELTKELAKVQEVKDGLKEKLKGLDEHSAKWRAHWKSQQADADREIRDHRQAMSNFEQNLAVLQDKLAHEVARAKELTAHYDAHVAKLEQDVADSQKELDKASAAKKAAVDAFTEEREKWQQSHRENRAMERKMAEERKSLVVQSQDLDLRLSQKHRQTRLTGLGPELGGQRLRPSNQKLPALSED